MSFYGLLSINFPSFIPEKSSKVRLYILSFRTRSFSGHIFLNGKMVTKRISETLILSPWTATLKLVSERSVQILIHSRTLHPRSREFENAPTRYIIRNINYGSKRELGKTQKN